MNKAIVVIIITMMIVGMKVSGEDFSYPNFKNSFGLKASNISGYGFYYKRNLSKEYSLQIMGLAYYYYNQTDGRIHKNYDYDIGMEIQRNVYWSENSRFFFLAGGYYYYDNDVVEESPNRTEIGNNSYNVGLGVGWEYFYHRFIFSADLGYKFFEDRKIVTKNGILPYPELYRVTKFGGGIGVGFLF